MAIESVRSSRRQTDLTHVAAFVGLLDLSDVKVPGAGLVVGDAHTRVVSDHSAVQTQDRLVVRSQPAHLSPKKIKVKIMK